MALPSKEGGMDSARQLLEAGTRPPFLQNSSKVAEPRPCSGFNSGTHPVALRNLPRLLTAGYPVTT